MAWGDSLLTSYPDIQLSGRFPTQTLGPNGERFANWNSTGGATEASGNWDKLAIGLMVAGAVSSAVDSYNTYAGKAESLRGQSQAYAGNAEMAELAAQQAQRVGQAQIAQLTLRAGQLKAKQRAGFAARGIAGNVGSTAETLATTEAMKQVDKQTAAMNALQQSWGYRRQSYQLNAQSKAANIMARANQRAAGVAAFGSLLSSAARVAGSYYTASAFSGAY